MEKYVVRTCYTKPKKYNKLINLDQKKNKKISHPSIIFERLLFRHLTIAHMHQKTTEIPLSIDIFV